MCQHMESWQYNIWLLNKLSQTSEGKCQGSHIWPKNKNVMTLSVIIGQSFKGIVHLKMETIVIYAPSSCSKPVWVSFFCWTKEEVL